MWRKLLVGLLAFVCLVTGVLFSLQNQVAVKVDLLVVSPLEHSVAFWLVSFFVVGVAVGFLTLSLLVAKQRALIARLRGKVRRLEKQNDERG